jgi:SAM-dependent methyltransferase
MHFLAYILALFLLAPDQAWSQGVRGNRGAGRGLSGFVQSGSASTMGPRFGGRHRSFSGHRNFIPRSPVAGAHFRRKSFVRFTLPGRLVIQRFYPPFIYYHRYQDPPWLGQYGYYPYQAGTAIIEVPALSNSTATSSNVPGLPAEHFAPAPLLERPSVRAIPEQLAPFDPTPTEVVDRMLALGSIKTGDLLYDLGSGDGRVLIAAAKKYRIKAVGFEVDAGLVKLAREKIEREKLEQLVEVRHQDFMTADLSSASVVMLYLSHDGNQALKPTLLRQLQPGARVVSYTFDMGDWPPKIAESYRDGAGNVHALYFWEIAQAPVYSDSGNKTDLR